ncbi:hypothetical protein L873DRAFT_1786149 [Choiromyces venosus 120613-1]|uniref:Uncharacterized protein n=1 Tax=Choiromyces venosus 120613-1 TaxID=1336337 RepID=A0A3N4K547_9PEZI|nr:hypothetical protein L873DRAFT_1786149 [Choiromyces venosus 120613-1]
MSASSSSSGPPTSQQTIAEVLESIPVSQRQTSRNHEEGNPSVYEILFPFYERAQASEAKILRAVSQVPVLAELSRIFLAREMRIVSDAYFGAIMGEDVPKAQKVIEDAIPRIEAFFRDLSNRWWALRTGRHQVFTQPGPRPPVIFKAVDSPGEVGKSSAMGAIGEQEQREQSQPSGVLARDPDDNLEGFVGSVRRSQEEIRREKVIHHWRVAMDRLKEKDASA